MQTITPASVIEVINNPVAIVAEASTVEVVEPLQQKAEKLAGEYKIDKQVLFNLIDSESKWDPTADNGSDRGLVQINRKSWPEVNESQAFDPDFSIRFAAEKISKNQQSLWTVCNCYSYAKVLLGKIPKMSELIPNTTIPRIGSIAVFYYNKVKHIAVITKVTEEGVWVKEANYEPCKTGSRLVKWGDKALAGFVNVSEET